MQRQLANGNYIQVEVFHDGEAPIVVGIGSSLRDMTFTDMTFDEAEWLVDQTSQAIELGA